jgi:hypothetical protein
MREVGGHDPAFEPLSPLQLQGEVERPRTRIEVRAGRLGSPIESADGLLTPRSVDVQAQDMIQQIVPWSDLGEDALNLALPLGPCLRGRVGWGLPRAGES